MVGAGPVWKPLEGRSQQQRVLAAAAQKHDHWPRRSSRLMRGDAHSPIDDPDAHAKDVARYRFPLLGAELVERLVGNSRAREELGGRHVHKKADPSSRGNDTSRQGAAGIVAHLAATAAVGAAPNPDAAGVPKPANHSR